MTTPTSSSHPVTGVADTSVRPGPPEFALGGSITRLHPFDGLFLRAEHLEQMQAYTSSLTEALGRAGGPGVVYGLTVRRQNGRLEVGAGLAFTPNGRPLGIHQPKSFDVEDLVDEAEDKEKGSESGVWVVELVAAAWRFGDEEVFGRLCDDPCGGAVTTQPFVAEGARVRLRGWTFDERGSTEPTDLRSAMASAWFEEERTTRRADERSLLSTSERDDVSLTNLRSDRWSTATGAPAGDAVPIGILLPTPSGDAWEVDVWSARRDRIDTPPKRAWQWRLGMRPWDVFLAQVLQFQAHLAGRWTAPDDWSALSDLPDVIKAFIESDAAARSWLVPKLALSGDSTDGLLRGHGFIELPPAGFLPLARLDESIEAGVRGYFPQDFPLELCAARPDYIAHAVEASQHLDRIRLVRDSDEPWADVDILVPLSGPYDPEESLETDHTWVAFHRRRERRCQRDRGEGSPVEAVAVKRASKSASASKRASRPRTKAVEVAESPAEPPATPAAEGTT